MAVRPGDRALYVAEQTGRVRAIRDGRLDPEPVLDVSSQIVAGGEQGLLGLAFSPDGRFLYVDFTDRNGDTHVTEFAMRGGRPTPPPSGSCCRWTSRRQPQRRPAASAPTAACTSPWATAQRGRPERNGSRSAPCSARSSASTRGPQRPPLPNPAYNLFAASRAPARDLGLRPRNPWRFSFDPPMTCGSATSARTAGKRSTTSGPLRRAQLRLNLREGTHRFADDCPAYAVDPVIEYGHDNGACTVIGGVVYRGHDIPAARRVPVRRFLRRLDQGRPRGGRPRGRAARSRPERPPAVLVRSRTRGRAVRAVTQRRGVPPRRRRPLTVAPSAGRGPGPPGQPVRTGSTVTP